MCISKEEALCCQSKIIALPFSLCSLILGLVKIKGAKTTQTAARAGKERCTASHILLGHTVRTPKYEHKSAECCSASHGPVDLYTTSIICSHGISLKILPLEILEPYPVYISKNAVMQWSNLGLWVEHRDDEFFILHVICLGKKTEVRSVVVGGGLLDFRVILISDTKMLSMVHADTACMYVVW